MLDISKFRSELARFFSEDGPGSQPTFPDACEGDLCLWTDGSALGDARQLGTGGGSAFAVTIVAGGEEHYVASYAERLEPAKSRKPTKLGKPKNFSRNSAWNAATLID